MFPRDRRGAIIVATAIAFLGLVSNVAAQTGTVTGKILDKDGKPLAYANVILVGTTLGAMSLSDGKFTVVGVPAGTYTIRAMMMGYKTSEKPGVTINSGESESLNFSMEQTIVAKTQVIEVRGERPMVEVTESKVTASVSDKQLQTMPVDDVLDAVAPQGWNRQDRVTTCTSAAAAAARSRSRSTACRLTIRWAAVRSVSACWERPGRKSSREAWTLNTATRSPP